jgi:hypothetical protein
MHEEFGGGCVRLDERTADGRTAIRLILGCENVTQNRVK